MSTPGLDGQRERTQRTGRPRTHGTGRIAARLHSLEARSDEVSATLSIGRRERTLAHRASGMELDRGYEQFVAAALPIAMRFAGVLRIPAPVSRRLLASSAEIQRALESWSERINTVRIEAPPPRRHPSGGRGVAAFFTAGVDSFYTALRHREALAALIYVHGFDPSLDASLRRERAMEGVRKAAAALGLRLIEVESNLREVSRGCPWGRIYHGAALASVALALAPEFERVLIPATHSSQDLFPWGSHLLLDPLWSTEAVTIEHDGAVPRPEKLALIAGSDAAMTTLRVCFQDTSRYNCGRCEKCLRTMVGLHVAGALDRCATLPHRLPLRRLSRISVQSENVLAFARENLSAAEALGARPSLVRTLRRVVERGSEAVEGPGPG